MRLTNSHRLFIAAVFAVFVVVQLYTTKVFGFRSAESVSGAENSILLKVEEYRDYLNFKGSPLTPMVCVHVLCRHNKDDGQSSDDLIAYEDLWYRGGDFIGCRRYHELPIAARDTVDMELAFDKQPCTGEAAGAGANAATRLLLDCALNMNTLTHVQVPDEDFFLIVEQFERHGFAPYALAFRDVSANISINLRTEHARRLCLLYTETR